LYNEFERRVGFSLPNHQLMLTLTGSHAYGLNTPTSDYDYLAVVLPPFARYYGLSPWTDFCPEAATVPEGLDIKVYSLRKYVELLRKGNFNIVETLFFNPEAYYTTSPLFRPLFDVRNEFLTQNLITSILGYARAEIKRLEAQELNKDSGARRRELYETHGYDPKAVGRLVHLLLVAEGILETGVMRPNMPEHKEMLLEIKSGMWPWADVSIISNKLFSRIKQMDESGLPKQVSTDLCNDILFTIQAKYYIKDWLCYAAESV